MAGRISYLSLCVAVNRKIQEERRKKYSKTVGVPVVPNDKITLGSVLSVLEKIHKNTSKKDFHSHLTELFSSAK